jgi:hypothetical protein
MTLGRDATTLRRPTRRDELRVGLRDKGCDRTERAVVAQGRGDQVTSPSLLLRGDDLTAVVRQIGILKTQPPGEPTDVSGAPIEAKEVAQHADVPMQLALIEHQLRAAHADRTAQVSRGERAGGATSGSNHLQRRELMRVSY